MLKFSEMPYSRPDVGAVKQELNDVIDRFTAAET